MRYSADIFGSGSLYSSASAGPQEFEPTPAILPSTQTTLLPHFSSSKLCRFEASSSWVYCDALNEKLSGAVNLTVLLPSEIVMNLHPQCEPFSWGRI